MIKGLKSTNFNAELAQQLGIGLYEFITLALFYYSQEELGTDGWATIDEEMISKYTKLSKSWTTRTINNCVKKDYLIKENGRYKVTKEFYSQVPFPLYEKD